MNKKYLIYSLSIALLMVCKPSFSMGGKVFTLARGLAVGTLPALGVYDAYKREKAIPKVEEILKQQATFTKNAVHGWFLEKKEALNLPNAESISLVSGDATRCGGWAAYSGKGVNQVVVSPEVENLLNNVLVNNAVAEKKINHSLRAIKNLEEKKTKKMLLCFYLILMRKLTFTKNLLR